MSGPGLLNNQPPGTQVVAKTSYSTQERGYLSYEKGDSVFIVEPAINGVAVGKIKRKGQSDDFASAKWELGKFSTENFMFIPPKPLKPQLKPSKSSDSPQSPMRTSADLEDSAQIDKIKSSPTSLLASSSSPGFSTPTRKKTIVGANLRNRGFTHVDIDKTDKDLEAMIQYLIEPKTLTALNQKEIEIAERDLVSQMDKEELEHVKYKYLHTALLFAKSQAGTEILPDFTLAETVRYDISKIKFSLPPRCSVTFAFPNKFSKTVSCDIKMTPMEALEKVYVNAKGLVPANSTALQFLIKVTGQSQILDPTIPFENFVFIREQLRKNSDIELTAIYKTEKNETLYKTLIRKRSETKDTVFAWSLVDPPIKYNEIEFTSHLQIVEKFSLQLLSVCNLPFAASPDVVYYFEVSLCLGSVIIDKVLCSKEFSVFTNYHYINHTVEWSIGVWQVPRGSKLKINLYRLPKTSKTEKTLLGKNEINIVAFNDLFPEAKEYSVRLTGTTSKVPPEIKLKFPFLDKCEKRVKFTRLLLTTEENSFPRVGSQAEILSGNKGLTIGSKWVTETIPYMAPDTNDIQELSTIVETQKPPSLYPLTDRQKKLTWDNRYLLANKPYALAKCILCTPWDSPPDIGDLFRALKCWSPPSPVESMELLDIRFGCPEVRDYAVSCMYSMPCSEMKRYLLQLVQALKFESYFDSSLARLLLAKALQDRYDLGQYFFWLLKSEIGSCDLGSSMREFFKLLLECYCRGCGRAFLEELVKQARVMGNLAEICKEIQSKFPYGSFGTTVTAKKTELLRRLLTEKFGKTEDGILPLEFRLPNNPSIILRGVIVNLCSVLDSAKMPLWIVCLTSDTTARPVQFIFKNGDDLRQDMLTLNVFRLMDQFWKEEGFDMGMSLYDVLTTGENQGIIQVVPNSQTIAKIHRDRGVNGMFQEDSIQRWLEDQNVPVTQSVIETNFMHSCAAYCVATYVLGIGDRHSSNIMITKFGHLFHIDFGHFLGNVKQWFGISRERAPMIFTPDFAFVMGGKESKSFKQFVQIACQCFGIVRSRAAIFVNLFALMLSTGIPELKSFEDIEYLGKCLMLDESMTQKDVEDVFGKLIYASLNSKSTQINFFFHNLAH